MSTDRTFKTHSTDGLAETNEPAKTRENPGRELPGVSEGDDKQQYPTATDKSISSVQHWTERTDLRRCDEHGSRHDVRAACHCGPEGHE